MASFQLDNDVALGFQLLLQLNGHEVITADNIGLSRVGDEVQLLVAAESNHIFITNNVKDFLLLHHAWRRWTASWGAPRQHAGILIIPQVKPSERPAMALQVSELVTSRVMLRNELYRWRPSIGWIRDESVD